MARKTADDIVKLIADEEVEYVDIRFCDMPGVVQHFSIRRPRSTNPFSRTGWCSTARRFAASSRSTSPT